jgi:hypothetical protein
MGNDPVFVLESARPRGRLEFRWTGPSYMDVVLEDRGLRATANVHAIVSGPDNLPTAFFDDLAQNWRGWRSAKEWESYEGDFQLRATTDGRGHVFLLARLAAGLSEDCWSAQAMLVVEAGQLEACAKDMHFFARNEPRAA